MTINKNLLLVKNVTLWKFVVFSLRKTKFIKDLLQVLFFVNFTIFFAQRNYPELFHVTYKF